jgi:hypothetical protein
MASSQRHLLITILRTNWRSWKAVDTGPIDWFYRSGTQEELETATRQWLETTIARLERIVRQEADSLSIGEFSKFMRRISF